MDPFIKSLVLSIALPALLATVTSFVSAGPTREDAPAASFRAGLGMTIAFWTGWAFLFSRWPHEMPWLPRESTHWLLYVPVAATFAALLFAFMREGGARFILIVILVSGLTLAQISPLWKSWKPLESVWITVLLLALGAIGWTMVARVINASSRPTGMIWVTTLLSLAAVAVASSGSATLGLTCGIFAAVVGPLVLVSWWRPNAGVYGIVAPLASLALLSVLINARFYSELGLGPALLLVATPLLAWFLVRFGPRDGFLASDWVRLPLSLIPAAVAAVQTALAAAKSAGESGGW